MNQNSFNFLDVPLNGKTRIFNSIWIFNYCYKFWSTVLRFLSSEPFDSYLNINFLFLKFLPFLGFDEVGLALVFAVLPFMGMLAKPLAGWLADRFNLQKTIFMASIVLSGTGMIWARRMYMYRFCRVAQQLLIDTLKDSLFYLLFCVKLVLEFVQIGTVGWYLPNAKLK